jgi:hypothetical protein
MLIDSQLRQRILRSLRWLVRDAQYRFDDCKLNNEPGSQGGYSAEMTEAIRLLDDLEQGTMLLPEKPNPAGFTEQNCKDVGYLVGMTEKQAVEFYLHYSKQGWLQGNGLPIIELKSAMRIWQLHNQKDATPELVRNRTGKTPRDIDIEKRGG